MDNLNTPNEVAIGTRETISHLSQKKCLNKYVRSSKFLQNEYGDARIFISARSSNVDAVDQALLEKKNLTNIENGMYITDVIGMLVEEHVMKNMFEKKISSHDSSNSVNP